MVYVFVNFSWCSDDNDGDCGDDDVYDDGWLVVVYFDFCYCLWYCFGCIYDVYYVYDVVVVLKMYWW